MNHQSTKPQWYEGKWRPVGPLSYTAGSPRLFTVGSSSRLETHCDGIYVLGVTVRKDLAGQFDESVADASDELVVREVVKELERSPRAVNLERIFYPQASSHLRFTCKSSLDALVDFALLEIGAAVHPPSAGGTSRLQTRHPWSDGGFATGAPGSRGIESPEAAPVLFALRNVLETGVETEALEAMFRRSNVDITTGERTLALVEVQHGPFPPVGAGVTAAGRPKPGGLGLPGAQPTFLLS